MNRYHFLLTRRWLTILLVAILVAAVCVMLGRWQWNRHESRAAANNLVTTNYDAPPVALDTLVEVPGSVPAGTVWLPVEVTGQFVGEQLTLRNRPVEGSDSTRVLAVLEVTTDDGGALVVVDRGWLAGESTVAPAYPQGQVPVTGRLRQAEPVDTRSAPAGQVFRIDPATVLAAADVQADLPVLDGYLLAEVPPASATGAELQQFPRPATDPGSHLSYAFQWWVFAAGALVGTGILARREAADLAGSPAPAKRRSTDADAEDAIVDAQLTVSSRRDT